LPSFGLKDFLPYTEQASEQALSIPVHPSLSKRDLRRIADAVSKTAEKLGD
jgi:dTDP-4-amino-4,6-dideoxygalactose transaminase